MYPRLLRYLVAVAALLVGTLLLGCQANDTEATDTGSTSRMKDVGQTELPSLAAKLAERKASFSKSAPKNMKQDFATGIEKVRQSGVLESAKKLGDVAPDFALPGAHGDTVHLDELLKEGPVVLAWYRGGWCPYCNLELAALREATPRFEALGATLVAISPQLPDSSLSTKERNELPFIVLSDVGNAVGEEYGIVYRQADEVNKHFEGRIDLEAYNGDASFELPLPVTYVVDTDGVIRFAFVDADYTERAEPADVIAALQKLQSM